MKMNKTIITIIMIITLIPVLAISVNAELIAVSQLGYHTESTKEATIYTQQSSGTFAIRNLDTNKIDFSGNLVKAKDTNDNPVNCQGNNPCLVADFTNFKKSGTYRVEALSLQSPIFNISDDIFEDNAPVFLEFFDALLQQNSAYHEDLHSYANPALSIKADGSFIMEAHQATITLMRLGRAYRENPSLWDINIYSPLKSNSPDIIEHIVIYADYVKGLQGVEIQERTDGVGFRLDPSVEIHNAFVPGPTDLTELDVYIPGKPPKYLETVDVLSMCAPHDDSSRWDTCIEEAALYYKCQIDEPCLNMSYIQKTGVLISNDNGFGISRGWGYEFGCYQDIILDQEMYADSHNPCNIFYPEVSRSHTIEGMTAYLYALPAIHDYDTSLAQEYFNRAHNTYNYINNNFDINFNEDDDDAGYYGAALFLFYEYTDNVTFLEKAHELKNTVNRQFLSDATRGNNMYWHEYIRNKNAIISNDLDYNISEDVKDDMYFPEGLLRGKMYFDYDGRGIMSMDRNAERIYEFDRNIQFQNSRYMLLEGLFALQTLDLHPSPEAFIKVVADSQIAWLTGKNGVQAGTATDSPIKSYSFIFGIGQDNPEEFHSRYLVNSGYYEASNGEVVGFRGTSLQFLDTITKNVTFANATASDFVYLDAKFSILGKTFGSEGNRWRDEPPISKFQVGRTFLNGKDYIPGWINGVYDHIDDTDIIFNYRDSVDTYEFTESTNEIVSIAMEYFSMIDRYYNDRPVHAGVKFDLSGVPITPEPIVYGVSIKSNHTGALLLVDGVEKGITPKIVNLTEGSYEVKLLLEGYENETGTINVNSLSISFMFNLDEIVVEEPQDNIIIESNSSTLPEPSEGKTLPMTFEEEEMTFYLELDGTAQVEWKVMRKDVLFYTNTTVAGMEHEFKFKPDIFYAGQNLSEKIKNTKIIATVKGTTKSYTWEYEVRDVFNVFFDPHINMSPNTRVEVKVYNQKHNFSSVVVTIRGKDYILVNDYEDEEETKWTLEIGDMQLGANRLTHIYGIVNDSYAGNNVSLDLTKMSELREYYRESPPPSNPGNTGGGGSPSGGSTAALPPPTLQLIYTILEKNVLMYNDTQELRLDANSTRGDISKIEAVLIDPLGFPREYQLSLISGTGGYGTWNVEITSLITGPWRLNEIIMYDEQGRETRRQITDREFYVVSDEVSETEELQIVYTALSASEANANETVELRLDARDSTGVDIILARIISNKGFDEEIPLSLVSGTKNYGTWEAIMPFHENTSDETFSVIQITLANNNSAESYNISERSVYVKQKPTAVSNVTMPPLTGLAVSEPLSRESVLEALKSPFASTIIAFLATLIILIAAFGIWSAKRN